MSESILRNAVIAIALSLCSIQISSQYVFHLGTLYDYVLDSSFYLAANPTFPFSESNKYFYNEHHVLDSSRSDNTLTHYTYYPNAELQQNYGLFNGNLYNRKKITYNHFGAVIAVEHFRKDNDVFYPYSIDSTYYGDNGNVQKSVSFQEYDGYLAKRNEVFYEYDQDNRLSGSFRIYYLTGFGSVIEDTTQYIYYEDSGYLFQKVVSSVDDYGTYSDTTSYFYDGDWLEKIEYVEYWEDELYSHTVETRKNFPTHTETTNSIYTSMGLTDLKTEYRYFSDDIRLTYDSMVTFYYSDISYILKSTTINKIEEIDSEFIKVTIRKQDIIRDDPLGTGSIRKNFYKRKKVTYPQGEKGTIQISPNPSRIGEVIQIKAEVNMFDLVMVFNANGEVVGKYPTYRTNHFMIQSPVVPGLYYMCLFLDDKPISETQAFAVF